MWRQTVCCLAALGVVLASASATQAQGTIAYFRPETPISFGPLPGFDYCLLDMDGDGATDFVVDTSSLTTVVFAGERFNRFLGRTEWDGGVWVTPLSGGSLITSIPMEATWAERGSISACAWPFGCVGPWIGLTAYAGVQLPIGENTHYGWIRIEHFEYSNAGRILDWAYETRPGVPILAGAVPEPSTFALLVGGGVVVVWFRKQRNGRKKAMGSHLKS